MTYTIAVSDYDFPDLSVELAAINDTDVDVELVTADADSSIDVINAVPDADGLLVQYTEITEAVFEEFEDLQALGRYGIGVDNVDMDAATDHGVQVLNVPTYCEEEVSVHALSLALDCIRNVSLYDREISNGNWDWTDGKPIRRISEQTIGFTGFGKIPERLTTMLEGFDLRLVGYDPYLSSEEFAEYGVEKVNFDELLSISDLISIHAPLTDETRHLFDDEAFAAMREDAIVVNTARGELIDTNALAHALENDEIGGAGLDVMPEEPPTEDDFSILERDDVVCTPHVAWYSEESMVEMRQTVTEDVIGVISDSEPINPVNKLD